MKILIVGVDGYLGWPLALTLVEQGYDIIGVDCGLRRTLVKKQKSHSAIPIATLDDRLNRLKKKHRKRKILSAVGNIVDYSFVHNILEEVKPDVIVHLGEIPSAPYSMIDVHSATYTQMNNIFGTLNILYAMHAVCPKAHLIKLGTMGEYGTPNIDIPEGFIDIEQNGRTDTLPFPKQAGSWYHQSKVHDTNNIMMASKIWGLRVTDIMQGVVYGTRIDEMGDDPMASTRLDFDQSFGTVINRFCCQATIGAPLSIYGIGQHKRSFLPLKDSMRCLSLVIENPPKNGEYRVFNQFADVFSIVELAEIVCAAGKECGLQVVEESIKNPREEAIQHYYNPECKKLKKLGYIPTGDIFTEVKTMLIDLAKHKARIDEKADALNPSISWR